MKRRGRITAGILLILLGIGIFLYPEMTRTQMEYRTRKVLEHLPSAEEIPPESGEEGSGDPAEQRLQRVMEYNRELLETGQQNFNTAEAVTQIPSCAAWLPEGLYGSLEIPAMDLVLPLYLGATEEHLARGAALLGETSLPVGGDGTNAVIAGHRGYRGIPFFREIEELEEGDPVYVTGPWGQLTYLVCEIRVIDPSDSDALRIRPGEDLVTLFTCHPYRSGGKYRYVVTCRRAEEGEASGDEKNETETEDAAAEFSELTSREDIRREDRFRQICGVWILASAAGVWFFSRKKK